MASLLPAAVATLLASRLILRHYDIDVFNAYTLVFTTMVLIPLNDLGAGAALTSAIAADGTDDEHTQRVALTAARVLLLSGMALVAVALLISAFSWWGEVLGRGSYASNAFGLAIAAYGLSFVPGLGQSALLGANKNDLTIIVQGFLQPVMCVGAAVCVIVKATPAWVIVVPGVAVFAVALVNAWVSARVTKLHLLPLLPKLPFLRRHPGARIRGIAGPALILTLTSPITLQGDRFVLSHFSTDHAVANYTVAVQIWAPLVALISAAARPLWPIFTQARAQGTRAISASKVIVAFVGLTAIGSGFLFVVSGPVAKIIGGDQIHLGTALPLAMAVAVAIQAAAVPLGMMLMYPAGLRLIATLSLLATPLNLGLSILVSPSLGAPGPLYVSIVVALFLQTIPAMVHLRRHGIETTGDATALAPIPAPDDQALQVDAGLALVGPTPPTHAERGEEAARPAPLPPPRPGAVPTPAELEPLVRRAVEGALTDAIVQLRFAPSVLPGPTSSLLDRLRAAVERIDRQAEQLGGVAARLDGLTAALEELRQATQDLAGNVEEIDPPAGAWPEILQGGERAIRTADDMALAVRDRRRRAARPR
jgi:O-antigen/teichoic acid export membrane protein